MSTSLHSSPNPSLSLQLPSLLNKTLSYLSSSTWGAKCSLAWSGYSTLFQLRTMPSDLEMLILILILHTQLQIALLRPQWMKPSTAWLCHLSVPRNSVHNRFNDKEHWFCKSDANTAKVNRKRFYQQYYMYHMIKICICFSLTTLKNLPLLVSKCKPVFFHFLKLECVWPPWATVQTACAYMRLLIVKH